MKPLKDILKDIADEREDKMIRLFKLKVLDGRIKEKDIEKEYKKLEE
jgi:hypothetical protein